MSRIRTLGLATALLLVGFAILKSTTGSTPGDVWVDGRSLDHWVNAAAGGSNDAQAVLEKLDSKYIPALCRRATLSPSERFWEGLSIKVPVFRRFAPDRSKLGDRQAAILNALRKNADWGGHTAEIVKTACAASNQDVSGKASEAAAWLMTVIAGKSRREPEQFQDTKIITEVGNALTNRSYSVQYGAICSLGNFGRSASNWIPLLKKRYDSHGRTLAQHAAHAVWRISGEREEPLTILLLGFTSKQHDVYNWTRFYLSEMAPGSLPSMPAQKVLADDNPEAPGRRKLPGLPVACGPGGPLALQIIEHLQKSEDVELAEAAVEAARRLKNAAP